MNFVESFSMWMVIWGTAFISGHMVGRIRCDYDYRGKVRDSIIVGIGLVLVLIGQFIEPFSFISLSGAGLGALIVSLIIQTTEASDRDTVRTGIYMGLGIFLILAGLIIHRAAIFIG